MGDLKQIYDAVMGVLGDGTVGNILKIIVLLVGITGFIIFKKWQIKQAKKQSDKETSQATSGAQVENREIQENIDSSESDIDDLLDD